MNSEKFWVWLLLPSSTLYTLVRGFKSYGGSIAAQALDFMHVLNRLCRDIKNLWLIAPTIWHYFHQLSFCIQKHLLKCEGAY